MAVIVYMQSFIIRTLYF